MAEAWIDDGAERGARRERRPGSQRSDLESEGPRSGAYPEQPDDSSPRLDRKLRAWVSPITRRLRERSLPIESIPEAIRIHASSFESRSDGELRAEASALGAVLRESGLAGIEAHTALALVREASKRWLGMTPYDVQLAGAWVLLQGFVAEMETGEGKTLTASLAAAVAGLAGIPTHIVTVNDYLARRDAETLAPLYEGLGLRVGLVASEVPPDERRLAYRCDVTYVTNKDAAFDYLRDRVTLGGGAGRLKGQLERLLAGKTQLLHQGLHFAIVDEADSVLIDEARTPLILSRKVLDPAEVEIWRTALGMAARLEEGVDFTIGVQDRSIEFSEAGRRKLAAAGDEVGGVFRGARRREALTRQGVSALHLFHRDRDYVVHEGKVQIVDEFTGRLMPDRSWEQGIHQLVELKEDVEVSGRQETLARISYQRFFGRYLRVAGMTGTAREASGELWRTYGLATLRIPTHRPVIRESFGEQIFETADERWRAVVARVEELHEEQRPVLVATRSVQASEHLSELLGKAGIGHEVLNARHDSEEAEIVARAGERGRVTVATNMAGRGTDIPLGDGMRELGGLHVIATERHEAGRIDRQLFGRTGRQGEPGSYEVMASLEDELAVRYAPAWARVALGAARSVPVAARGRLLRAAQRRAERLHVGARRELVRQDEQMEKMLAFTRPPA